jgi:hypothetical protein
MCERGFGKPMTPFQLADIAETTPFSVSLSDFLLSKNAGNPDEIAIRFLTPVILYRLKEKKNTQMSYQDKTNRFPSFYQLVRSSFSRLQKLYALYAEPNDCTPSLFDESFIESYLDTAGRPLLKSADIKHITLQNTQKKGKKNEMPLAGYVGEQKYTGAFQPYLPLLKFMTKIGVGNETVYGMGRFDVDTQLLTHRISENQKIEVENEISVLDGFVRQKEAGMCDKVMLKLPQLIVRYKNQITQGDVPLFAEAITSHNMLIADSTRYVYPVIQFKRLNGYAAIICIGEGTERIGGFFTSVSGSLTAGNEVVAIEIESVKAEKITVQAWEHLFTYTLRKYLPLSSNKYAEYQNITDDNKRFEFIGEIVKSNIVLFTESIGIELDRKVVCQITELEEKTTVKYKNHTFVSFDLQFKTNVSLPDYIGLGIGVSHGFGMVARFRIGNN